MPKFIIGKREFEYEVELVNVGLLKFYSKNPRVYSILNIDEDEDPDQQTIYDYMKNDEHVKELMQSIVNNGGVINPLIVYNDVVFEGNSRLAACKKLYSMDPIKWGLVPCQVIKDQLDEDAIFVLLGTYHINGRKDWQPMEQAGYLYRRTKESKKNIDAIAGELSMPRAEAKRLLAVYGKMRENNETDSTKWSHYFEMNRFQNYLVKRDKATPTLNLEQGILDFIKSGKIINSQDLRKIGKIVKSTSPKVISVLTQYLSETITLDEALNEVSDTDAGEQLLKHVIKFRDVILSTEAKDAIAIDDGTIKFELSKIKKAIDTYLNKA